MSLYLITSLYKTSLWEGPEKSSPLEVGSLENEGEETREWSGIERTTPEVGSSRNG